MNRTIGHFAATGLAVLGGLTACGSSDSSDASAESIPFVDETTTTVAAEGGETTVPAETTETTAAPETTVAPETTAAPETTVSDVDAFDVTVGECMLLPGEDTLINTLEGVDCSAPHDAQAFALFDIPDGDFPGLTAVEAAMDEGCLERFEGFVGTSYQESSLYYTGLYPTSGSWDAGDREVVCLIVPESGQLELDVQNSGL